MTRVEKLLVREEEILLRRRVMSEKIDPEAMQPSTVQAFEFSDRNPAVVEWGGTDAEGGQIAAPAGSEARVTPEGNAVSADTGLKY
jgi:hypothetical protein